MSRFHNFFLPEPLLLQNVIKTHPPQIQGFRIEKLYYILDVITRGQALNPDISEDEKGFVPINAEVLRDNIGERYTDYLAYLVNAGVLQCNNHFVVGRHSRGYRFSASYRGALKAEKVTISVWMERKVSPTSSSPLSISYNNMPIEINTSNPLYYKLPSQASGLTQREQLYFNDHMRNVFPNVFKWYGQQGLQIDSAFAREYNKLCWKFRTYKYWALEKRWKRSLNLWVAKNAYNQQQANDYNILMLANGMYNERFDSNVFRMYSTLVTINKTLRPAISWKGNQLATVDISNSQPYLLAALLEPEFWTLQQSNKITLYNLPYYTKYSKTYPLQDIITLCNSFESNPPADVISFKQFVSSGRFYEQLGMWLPARKNGIPYTREELKRMMFQVLFSANDAINQNWALPKRTFAQYLPNVDKLIRLIQRSDNSNLACLLQRLESYIMFTRVMPRIDKQLAGIPVFTIHDGIVTLKGNEQAVATILENELHIATGLLPAYKIENWDIEEMKFSIWEQEMGYDYLVYLYSDFLG